MFFKNRKSFIVRFALTLTLLAGVFGATATRSVLASTIMVTTTADSGAGSLRQAIADAVSGDVIVFDPSLAGQTITLASPVIINDKRLILDGSGLFPQVTISGGSFILNGPSTINIYDLTLSGFNTPLMFRMDATIRNSTLKDFTGDVIRSYAPASLTIIDSTLEGNRGMALVASGSATTITNSVLRNNAGRAIQTSGSGSLTVTNSTISGSQGDAIIASGPTTITDSSVIGNRGLAIITSGMPLSLINTTIYQNLSGAMILNGSETMIVNSTIAQNPGRTADILVNGGSDLAIFNSTIVADTYRVLFLNGGTTLNVNNSILFCTHPDECFFSNGANIINNINSIVGENGTLAEYGLAAPYDNGGPTLTMALLSGSPLIDAGDDAVCEASPVNGRDQRGMPRPYGSHCDIGAYEYVEGPIVTRTPTYTPTITLTPSITPTRTPTRTPTSTRTSTSTFTPTTTPTLTPTNTPLPVTWVVVNTNYGGAGSLRQAIIDAGPSDIIHFDPALSGATINWGTQNSLTKNVTIDASNMSMPVTLDGRGTRLFSIAAGITVELKNLVLTNGGGYSIGGAVYNEGTLKLTRSVVSNSDANFGGGIYNDDSGQLLVTDSTFSGNLAEYESAAIDNRGTLMIENSAFISNSANPSCPVNCSGAIFNNGEMVVTNSAFYDNYPSAIHSFGKLTIKNSTLAYNRGFGVTAAGNTSTGTNTSELHFINTIMAKNKSSWPSASQDCYNHGDSAMLLTNINNLIESGNCGTPAVSSDPSLGDFGDYGGLTWTFSLLPGSPAIDAGDNAHCPSMDQRGMLRPQGAQCDVGAYEYNGPIVLTPTNTATDTPTSTPTDTPTFTPTSTATDTPTAIPTFTPSITMTPTITPSNTPTSTPTNTATYTPTITNTPSPTNTFTPTATPPYSYHPLYLSLTNNQTIGGVASSDEDILHFDGQNWSLLFDGSDVGVGSPDLFAFSLLDADTILMSFSANVTVNGITATPQDVLRFDATSLGSTTAGTFSLYFDGSDVGLSTTAENIDALSPLPDGRLLLSTTGNPSVPGLTTGRDEDVLAFSPTSLGSVTGGTWSLYFDGSDVGLAESSNEDLDAMDVVGGNIYLSTLGGFSVSGLSGADEDVFVCAADSTGDVTVCEYSPVLYFDGSTWGLTGNDVDAFSFPSLDPLP